MSPLPTALPAGPLAHDRALAVQHLTATIRALNGARAELSAAVRHSRTADLPTTGALLTLEGEIAHIGDSIDRLSHEREELAASIERSPR